MAKKKKPKPSLGKRLFKILYVLIVILSAIIVGLYCLWHFGIRPPEIEQPPVVTPPVVTRPPEDLSGEDDPVENTQPVETAPVLQRRDLVYTCLIVGVDDGNGNADTIMAATFDIPNQKIGLISIPRDTRVNVDRSIKKINAAYSSGGVQEVRAEVSDLLGIPIDYYVKIELSAFKKLVNAIGGVYFDVPVDMHYEDPYQDLYIHIDKGYQRLNGEQAMGVVRCRSAYASEDIGRMNTQQAFLKTMISQLMSAADLSNIGTFVEIINAHVTTNAGLDDMLYFAKQALTMDIGSAMTTATLPGDWHSPYIWVDREKALETINQHLNPYTTPVTAKMADIVTRN